MNIRSAAGKDLPQLLSIYEKARSFMASYGNENQWNNGYPQKELLEQDILQNQLYVLEEHGQPAAVFVFFIGEEPTYQIIENGCWPSSRPYGTIHRLASAGLMPHAADPVISWCAKQCRQANADLRGDTHEKNIPMQKAFVRNGFVKCGTIYVRDGSPRIAYHKNNEFF